ncbi:LysR family transcriptional regulator [Paenibacillus alba]|uniref:LysR family transcriptional regulator n=1 Tax=Paenibacillus alba TaxID=1197127 RepID=A0ABU6G157_9BACL|nr:LysR family transcriptional regulator [Paenibacillus alba]MEC0226509.1 LysR family transcriptional regulator [Paenibacillus alba]
MELRQLEYFAAICEEMHFTRAAERLGVTQPTLSHQIKALEDEIGTPLFDRIGKKIALTAAGSVMKAHTLIIFHTLSSAKDQINEIQGGSHGTLALGSLPGELNYLISSQLAAFNQQFPKVKIKISAAEDVIDKVLKNELDLAITIHPVDDDRLEQNQLYTEQFYVLAAKEHDLAKLDQIDFKEIGQHPVIMFPTNHRCRQLIDATCSTSGFHLEPFIETNTIDSIFSLVRSGVGVSILSKSLCDLKNDDNLKAIPIVNPTITRKVILIYLRGKYISRAARAYIDLVQQFVIARSDSALIHSQIAEETSR